MAWGAPEYAALAMFLAAAALCVFFVARSSTGRASGFGPEGSRFESEGASQRFTTGKIGNRPYVIFHSPPGDWFLSISGEPVSGPWGSLEQAEEVVLNKIEQDLLESAISLDREPADELAWWAARTEWELDKLIQYGNPIDA